jgi:hypothetical protein
MQLGCIAQKLVHYSGFTKYYGRLDSVNIMEEKPNAFRANRL